MKKLSIEEKTKRYDEALKYARIYYTDGDEDIKMMMKTCLPVLVEESEDERIRKSLIKLVKKAGEGYENVIDGVSIEDAIAWLEKQGEKDEEILILKDQIESLHAAIVAVKETHRIELEKQGEQKPIIEMKSAEESLGIDSETYNKIVDECIYGEQKPADKVEPKFKVGDWVVNTITDNVDQIIEVTSNEYVCSGTLIVSFDNQHLLKKWTIQDAKDGDVLAYRDGQWIFVYKGIVTKDTFKYYALLSEKGITVNDAAFSLLTSCIIPATKEQRDQLEKAMADAGYTFDSEKKELKKIEQKPAENEELTEFDKAVGVSIGTWNPKTPEQIQAVKAISEKLLKLAKKQINNEQKPAWGEEDIATISRVISIIKWAAYSDHSHPILNDKGATELVGRLKSLKDRYTWRPSDEQMQALSNAGNSFRPFEEGHKVLWSLYNDLKKLREE